VAEFNVEIRFLIWGMLSGVVFSDVGQVAREPFTLHLDDFRASAGGGARIRTPVGVLRFDYGRLINPPNGVAHGRFYFSIGQAF
jgi:outer membrane protein insertion porin family